MILLRGFDFCEAEIKISCYGSRHFEREREREGLVGGKDKVICHVSFVSVAKKRGKRREVFFATISCIG